jgi:hypothetical protein
MVEWAMYASTVGFVASGIGLIEYNKWLVSVDDFHYPILMTIFHSCVIWILTCFVVFVPAQTELRASPHWLTHVSWHTYSRRLLPIGVLSCVDITLTSRLRGARASFCSSHARFQEC